jgi:DNA-binding winged helix-turn-helix (wHTH) protein
VFNRDLQCVIVDKEYRQLRPTAWRLLEILWKRRDKTIRGEAILELLWGDRPDSIRKALSGSPYRIANVRSVGYRLETIGIVQPRVPVIVKPSRDSAQKFQAAYEGFARLVPAETAVDHTGSILENERPAHRSGDRVSELRAAWPSDTGSSNNP